ncbi:hypothetical protein L917_16241, partial [Phytophthora nicotianae]
VRTKRHIHGALRVFMCQYLRVEHCRTEDAYWDIANFVVQATDQLLELVEIICGFEAALMNAL